jgi:GNAT superfamily N-acetyltransferase
MTETQTGALRWTGYVPGAVGKITELHAVYYHENWGLDASFEAQVGKELSEFILEFQEGRDGLWVVSSGGELAGSIVIDGRQSDTRGARLRWLIVAPQFQNLGVGHELLNHAVDFCQKAGHRHIYLWTFEGLDTARVMYEHVGFRLSEEMEAPQWGKALVAQKFELDIEI